MDFQRIKTDALASIHELLSTTDNTIIGGIIVAVLVVLFSIIYWIWRKGSSARRSVLLMGLCDSGKTLLFSRLIHHKFLATQSSMKENVADYDVNADKKKSLRLVDLPGHDRLRQQYFDKFKASSRGIIFVVDSMTFQQNLKDVAELLYQLLTDRVIAKNSPSLLIACNKSDKPMAKGSRYVQTALEKELNNVRKTRSAALEATDGSASSAVFLGRRDQNFSFADLRPMSVEFIECSCTGQIGEAGCQVDDVVKWMSRTG